MADYKKIVDELEELIKKAPDIDMDKEFSALLKKYEKELMACKEHVDGLLPRLIFILDCIRFQHNVMVGGDIKESLHGLLVWAESMGHRDVAANFSDRQRMQKMAEMLEVKAHSLRCSMKDQVKKWAQ